MAIRRSPGGRDPSDFQPGDEGGGQSGNPIMRPALPGQGLAGQISHLPGGGPGFGGGDPSLGGGTAGGNGRGGFSPRENQDQSQQGGNATLRRPETPQPMAGSSFSPPVQSGPQGVQPFNPMSGGAGPGQMAGIGGLFGSSGGLKGGGLGVPLNPLGDAPNMDISQLLKMLMGGGGGQ